jgi:hypothetical protein
MREGRVHPVPGRRRVPVSRPPGAIRALRGALAVGAAGLALATLGSMTACDDKTARDDQGGNHAAAAVVPRIPEPPRDAPLSGELVAKARAVQVVGQALAATCSFEYRGVTQEEIYFDWCVYKKGDAGKLHDAVAALLSSGLVPETGPAASFAEEARMFEAFVSDADQKRPDEDYNYRAARERTRGTLQHYQDLASAWNAMLPQDPIPVDYGRTYFFVDAGGPRHWERCGGLACVRRTRP